MLRWLAMIVGSLIVLPLTAWQQPAPAVRQSGKLELQRPVERSLGPAQADVFTVDADAGQFLHVVAEQTGVDIVLTAHDPRGNVLVTGDSPNYELGPETISWIAAEAGTFTVSVTKAPRSSETGTYRIELLARSAPGEGQNTQIAAERSFYDAVAAENSPDKDAPQKALNLYQQAAGLWHQLSNSYEEALCLHRIGTLWSNTGDSGKALAVLENALAMRRDIGDQAGQATTLNNMALAYSSAAQQEKALALFLEAQSLAHAVGYRSMESRILTNLADAYDRSGDHARALDSYLQVVAVTRGTGNRAGEADALLAAGNAQYALDDKQKAIALYEQAAPIYRSIGNRRGESNALENIGNGYYALRDNPKALASYEQALPLDRSLADTAGQGHLLGVIGTIRFLLGRHPEALQAFDEALEIYRASGNRPAAADILASLGEVESASGEQAKALDYFQQALSVRRALDDRKGLGVVLNDIGIAYARQGDRQKALDAFQQNLEIRRTLADKAGEGGTLFEIASVYYGGGDRESALNYFEEALPILRAVGDRSTEGNALASIGVVSYEMRQFQKAVESFQGALAVKRALGDRAGEAATLGGIGTAYSALGDAKSVQFFEQSLSIYRSIADRANEASTLYNLGQAYYRILQDDQKASEVFQQALPLVKAAGNASAECNTLSSLGAVYSRQRQPSKALASYQEALAVARRSGYKLGEADALIGTAEITADRGHKREALPLLQAGLQGERESGNRYGEATALRNLCSITSELESGREAVPFCEQALAIERSAGLRMNEVNTLILLGDVHSHMGEQSKAIEDYQQAQTGAQSLHSPIGEIQASLGLGNVYASLGKQQEALKLNENALDSARRTHSQTEELIALNNLGVFYAYLGRHEEALKRSQEALQIERASGNRAALAAGLLTTGFVYVNLGENRKALKALQEAGHMFVQSGDLRHQSAALMMQGLIAYKEHKRKLAFHDFQEALPLARSAADPFLEATALTGTCLALIHSNADLAIVFGKQAINALQRVRRNNTLLEQGLQSSFEKEIEDIYRPVAGLLVQQERFGEAEDVLNLLKEKETADFVRRDAVTDELRSAALLDFEKKAVDRYDQVVSRIVAIGARKAELLAKDSLSTNELAESRGLDHDLEAANTVLHRFLDDQQKQFSENSALNKRVGEFNEAEGLQDALQKLGPDVVAIYTLVSPDRYIAMLVTSGARKAYTTRINQAELNRKIFEFRQALENPGSQPLPLAQELYHIVFPEGLRQDLESMHANTIMWSIDGTLRYLPIAALHDGKQYLVERFRNSLITPASLPRLTETSSAVWQGEGFGVSEAKASFRALPSVPQELHAIFKQVQTGGAPISGDIRLDAEFTRQTFEDDLRSRRNRVVHIATHFDSEPGVAASSHLLLGDGTEMSLAEIEAEPRLFNGVDLLTLSACSTAFTNRTEDGREVDSFGTIAQRLGAKAVIASLWSVNDEATARLMETMYRLWQKDPSLGKSEALRQVQIEMVTGALHPGDETGAGGRGVKVNNETGARDWSHPFYWAPFILIGNWK